MKAFANKKVNKLVRYTDDIIQAEMVMKVVKPDAPLNKDVSIRLSIRSGEVFASKSADSFEEAIDLTVEALEKQIMRVKAKNAGKQ